MLKRVFDVVASSCGLLILSPVLIGVAAWVKLDSPGPVFFRQVRVGRGGKDVRKYVDLYTAEQRKVLDVRPGITDVASIKYRNENEILGEAGIGLAQLKRYPEMLRRRREIIERYNKALEGMAVQVLDHFNDKHSSSGHLYLVRLIGKTREQLNDVITRMAERGIACNVHYKPLPMMTAYKKLGFDIKDYPNAYNQFVGEVTLPLHTKLTDEEVEYVINNFVDIIKGI